MSESWNARACADDAREGLGGCDALGAPGDGLRPTRGSIFGCIDSSLSTVSSLSCSDVGDCCGKPQRRFDDASFGALDRSSSRGTRQRLSKFNVHCTRDGRRGARRCRAATSRLSPNESPHRESRGSFVLNETHLEVSKCTRARLSDESWERIERERERVSPKSAFRARSRSCPNILTAPPPTLSKSNGIPKNSQRKYRRKKIPRGAAFRRWPARARRARRDPAPPPATQQTRLSVSFSTCVFLESRESVSTVYPIWSRWTSLPPLGPRRRARVRALSLEISSQSLVHPVSLKIQKSRACVSKSRASE